LPVVNNLQLEEPETGNQKQETSQSKLRAENILVSTT
jgi:hypothetical protein